MKAKIVFVFFGLLFLPGLALAQNFDLQQAQNNLNCWDVSLGRDTNASCTDPLNPGAAQNSQNAIFNVLDNITERLPFYLTGLAFIALLYSGGMYIFALGDATKMEAAKKNMTWAAIGMLVLALIGVIIRFAWVASTSGVLNSVNDIINRI